MIFAASTQGLDLSPTLSHELLLPTIPGQFFPSVTLSSFHGSVEMSATSTAHSSESVFPQQTPTTPTSVGVTSTAVYNSESVSPLQTPTIPTSVGLTSTTSESASPLQTPTGIL